MNKSITPDQKMEIFDYFGITCPRKKLDSGDVLQNGGGLETRVSELIKPLCNETTLHDIPIEVMWKILHQAHSLHNEKPKTDSSFAAFKNAKLISKGMKQVVNESVTTTPDYTLFFTKIIMNMISALDNNNLEYIKLNIAERITWGVLSHYNALVYMNINITIVNVNSYTQNYEITCTRYNGDTILRAYKGEQTVVTKIAISKIDNEYPKLDPTNEIIVKIPTTANTQIKIDELKKHGSFFRKNDCIQLVNNQCFWEFKLNPNPDWRTLSKMVKMRCLYAIGDLTEYVLGKKYKNDYIETFKIKIHIPLIEPTQVYDWTDVHRTIEIFQVPESTPESTPEIAIPMPFESAYIYLRLSDIYMEKILKKLVKTPFNIDKINIQPSQKRAKTQKLLININNINTSLYILEYQKVIDIMNICHEYMNPPQSLYSNKLSLQKEVHDALDSFISSQGGGKSCKKTKLKVVYNKKKYDLYIGPRGGKYIYINSKYMSIKRLQLS